MKKRILLGLLLMLSGAIVVAQTQTQTGALPPIAGTPLVGNVPTYGVGGTVTWTSIPVQSVVSGTGINAVTSGNTVTVSENRAYAIVTATSTLSSNIKYYIVNNANTNITLTLPAGDGGLFHIARIDNTSTGTITVRLSGGNIQAIGGGIGATTTIPTNNNQRSELFLVTGTTARRFLNQ